MKNIRIRWEKRWPALRGTWGFSEVQGGCRGRQRIIWLGRYYIRIIWSPK